MRTHFLCEFVVVAIVDDLGPDDLILAIAHATQVEEDHLGVAAELRGEIQAWYKRERFVRAGLGVLDHTGVGGDTAWPADPRLQEYARQKQEREVKPSVPESVEPCLCVFHLDGVKNG